MTLSNPRSSRHRIVTAATFERITWKADTPHLLVYVTARRSRHGHRSGGIYASVIELDRVPLDTNRTWTPMANNSSTDAVNPSGGLVRNLDIDNSCGFSTAPDESIVLVPANVAPLAFNRGRRSKRDSASVVNCPQRDQRFVSRPLGAGCDGGSTEQKGTFVARCSLTHNVD